MRSLVKPQFPSQPKPSVSFSIRPQLRADFVGAVLVLGIMAVIPLVFCCLIDPTLSLVIIFVHTNQLKSVVSNKWPERRMKMYYKHSTMMGILYQY